MEIDDRLAAQIHGILTSDSDSDFDSKRDLDKEYHARKPPPLDYESIRDKIVLIPRVNVANVWEQGSQSIQNIEENTEDEIALVKSKSNVSYEEENILNEITIRSDVADEQLQEKIVCELPGDISSSDKNDFIGVLPKRKKKKKKARYKQNKIPLHEFAQPTEVGTIHDGITIASTVANEQLEDMLLFDPPSDISSSNESGFVKKPTKRRKKKKKARDNQNEISLHEFAQQTTEKSFSVEDCVVRIKRRIDELMETLDDSSDSSTTHILECLKLLSVETKSLDEYLEQCGIPCSDLTESSVEEIVAISNSDFPNIAEAYEGNTGNCKINKTQSSMLNKNSRRKKKKKFQPFKEEGRVEIDEFKESISFEIKKEVAEISEDSINKSKGSPKIKKESVKGKNENFLPSDIDSKFKLDEINPKDFPSISEMQKIRAYESNAGNCKINKTQSSMVNKKCPRKKKKFRAFEPEGSVEINQFKEPVSSEIKKEISEDSINKSKGSHKIIKESERKENENFLPFDTESIFKLNETDHEDFPSISEMQKIRHKRGFTANKAERNETIEYKPGTYKTNEFELPNVNKEQNNTPLALPVGKTTANPKIEDISVDKFTDSPKTEDVKKRKKKKANQLSLTDLPALTIFPEATASKKSRAKITESKDGLKRELPESTQPSTSQETVPEFFPTTTLGKKSRSKKKKAPISEWPNKSFVVSGTAQSCERGTLNINVDFEFPQNARFQSECELDNSLTTNNVNVHLSKTIETDVRPPTKSRKRKKKKKTTEAAQQQQLMSDTTQLLKASEDRLLASEQVTFVGCPENKDFDIEITNNTSSVVSHKAETCFDDGFRDFLQNIIYTDPKGVNSLSAFTYEQLHRAYTTYKRRKNFTDTCPGQKSITDDFVSCSQVNEVQTSYFDNAMFTIVKSTRDYTFDVYSRMKNCYFPLLKCLSKRDNQTRITSLFRSDFVRNYQNVCNFLKFGTKKRRTFQFFMFNTKNITMNFLNETKLRAIAGKQLIEEHFVKDIKSRIPVSKTNIMELNPCLNNSCFESLQNVMLIDNQMNRNQLQKGHFYNQPTPDILANQQLDTTLYNWDYLILKNSRSFQENSSIILNFEIIINTHDAAFEPLENLIKKEYKTYVQWIFYLAQLYREYLIFKEEKKNLSIDIRPQVMFNTKFPYPKKNVAFHYSWRPVTEDSVANDSKASTSTDGALQSSMNLDSQVYAKTTSTDKTKMEERTNHNVDKKLSCDQDGIIQGNADGESTSEENWQLSRSRKKKRSKLVLKTNSNTSSKVYDEANNDSKGKKEINIFENSVSVTFKKETVDAETQTPAEFLTDTKHSHRISEDKEESSVPKMKEKAKMKRKPKQLNVEAVNGDLMTKAQNEDTLKKEEVKFEKLKQVKSKSSKSFEDQHLIKKRDNPKSFKPNANRGTSKGVAETSILESTGCDNTPDYIVKLAASEDLLAQLSFYENFFEKSAKIVGQFEQLAKVFKHTKDGVTYNAVSNHFLALNHLTNEMMTECTTICKLMSIEIRKMKPVSCNSDIEVPKETSSRRNSKELLLRLGALNDSRKVAFCDEFEENIPMLHSENFQDNGVSTNDISNPITTISNLPARTDFSQRKDQPFRIVRNCSQPMDTKFSNIMNYSIRLNDRLTKVEGVRRIPQFDNPIQRLAARKRRGNPGKSKNENILAYFLVVFLLGCILCIEFEILSEARTMPLFSNVFLICIISIVYYISLRIK